MWRIILSVLLIMIPTLVFGYFDKPMSMAISLFAGFVSAILINIDKIESFRAWHLEAKMRKAVKIIDEANATIDQLKSVTDPLLKSNLILLLYDGSFDGMGIKEKESVFVELLKVKDSLKLESVDKYINRAAKGIANHHFSELFRYVNDEAFRQKYEKYSTIYFFPETPSIDEVEQYFKDHPEVMTREIKDKLDKFKDFKESFLEK